MKFPVAIPRSAFKTLVFILAALCGAVMGAMFMLALRDLPIPDEFGKFLLAVGGVLGALIVGPKSRADETDDAPVSPERSLSD